MKFLNILQKLYCEPWAIVPEMHKQLCDIVDAHISGAAHEAGGIVSLIDEDQSKKKLFTVVEDIAVIKIDGVIAKRVSEIARSSGVTDLDMLIEGLLQVKKRDDICGVLLDVNSPGGSVTGVPEAAEVISDLATIKPVVAYTDMMMASAAFWLSAGASEIIASQSAMVGSIGVYMAFLDVSRQLEKEGKKLELFKTGKFKAIGFPGTSLTDEQREHLQAEVDMVFTWFKAAVLKNRVVPNEAMEGQTFMAEDAKRNGLIDGIGTVEDAMQELRMIGNGRV